MINARTRDDMRNDLFEAVFRRDLDAAEAVLDEMQRSGVEDEEIRRAKRRARPELRLQTASPIVETFPVPGHLPGSFVGSPRLADLA